jgi:hypothetical protein
VSHLDPDADLFNTAPHSAAEHTGYAVDCLDCELFGQPVGTSNAAAQLAAIHDDTHHRGVPTASICPPDRHQRRPHAS